MSKSKLESIKELTEIQAQDGNWNYDPYMHGMLNSLLMVIHILEDTDGTPPYKEAPEHWLADLKTLEKLNKSGIVIK